MIGSFFSEIEWTTVAMVIGMLASISAALFYGRHRRD